MCHYSFPSLIFTVFYLLTNLFYYHYHLLYIIWTFINIQERLLLRAVLKGWKNYAENSPFSLSKTQFNSAAVCTIKSGPLSTDDKWLQEARHQMNLQQTRQLLVNENSSWWIKSLLWIFSILMHTWKANKYILLCV